MARFCVAPVPVCALRWERSLSMRLRRILYSVLASRPARSKIRSWFRPLALSEPAATEGVSLGKKGPNASIFRGFDIGPSVQ